MIRSIYQHWSMMQSILTVILGATDSSAGRAYWKQALVAEYDCTTGIAGHGAERQFSELHVHHFDVYGVKFTVSLVTTAR